jgi:protein SCO1/2
VWQFATGDEAAVSRLAEGFGVSVIREGADPSGVMHNLRTAIIKPDGTLSSVLGGTDWTPETLLEAAKRARE